MWCDDFDMDLYRVLPSAREILAPVADVPLWTHSGLTDGKINCPSAWNTYQGLASFFGTGREHFKRPEYYTDEPLVSCTFEEAIRDLWVHQHMMLVDYAPIWSPGSYRQQFDTLMWHHRKWRELLWEEVIDAENVVLGGIVGAALLFERLPGVQRARGGTGA